VQQPGSRHEDDLTRRAEESGRTVEDRDEERRDEVKSRTKEREREGGGNAGASFRTRAHGIA